MDRLRECPFCGGTNIKIDAIPNVAQFYRCERCKAKGPYWTADEGSKEKWNTRATDPLLEEMAVALELSLLLVEMSTSYRSKDIAEQCKQSLQKYQEAAC